MKTTCASAIFTFLLLGAVHCFAGPYSIIDLGTLEDSDTSAYGVNDLGQVVGKSGDQAFLWDSDAGMQYLGNGEARGINNMGQVVGTSEGQAFLWDDSNGMQPLGTLGGHSSNAYAINNNGQIVGTSSLSGNHISHAFIWDQTGGMQDLNVHGPPSSGWDWSSAYSTNDHGHVAGDFGDDENHKPFIWDSVNGRQTLQIQAGLEYEETPGDWTYAFDVNNSGQVVGRTNFTDSHECGFLWENTSGYTDVGHLGDEWEGTSTPNAINDDGQVAGHSYTSDGRHAFVWNSATGMMDLNLLTSAPRFSLVSAEDINSVGRIAGYGDIDLNGDGNFEVRHAFLLTPEWDTLLTRGQDYVTDWVTIDETLELEFFFYMGTEPESFYFDILFNNEGEWETIASDITGNGTSLDWELLSMNVPDWAFGMTTQLKFQFSDWENTDPVLFLKDISSGTTPVPEPSTLLLTALGLCLLVFRYKRITTR